jgi:hypothetical protein
LKVKRSGAGSASSSTLMSSTSATSASTTISQTSSTSVGEERYFHNEIDFDKFL